MRLISSVLVVSVLFALATAGSTCFEAPKTPKDDRPDKSRLTLGTFNVEWLFEGKPEHTEAVAKTLAELDLDIVLMQEVENCEILKELVEHSALKAFNYRYYLVKGTDTATGQNVAMITRVDPSGDLWRTDARAAYPIKGNTCEYTGSGGETGVSKHFFTWFSIGKTNITVANQHFLAFPTLPERCAKREAQATVMRGELDKVRGSSEVIVVGDLNDYSADVPDSAKNVPTSRVVRIIRDGPIVGGEGGDATFTLTEVAADLKQSERYTCLYDTDKVSQIDHIMMSEGLAKNIEWVKIAHWTDTDVSDHWPFYLSIKTDAI